MNKALVAAAMAAVGLNIGCQQEGSWAESADESEAVETTSEGQVLATSPTLTTNPKLSPIAPAARLPPTAPLCGPRVKDYNPLDHHLAAIGSLTLECKQSIGPDDFAIGQDNRLEKRFKCSDERMDRDLDNLLGLQLVKESGANPYFADQWRSFLERHKNAGAPMCPEWKHISVEDAPNADFVKRLMSERPREVKTHHYWEIQPTRDCQEGACLIANANLCTSWLGVRFWEGGEPRTRIVKTDPSWWKDNTDYGTPDFFDDLGWTHRMATDTGWPPGDIWGAPARVGEFCTVYLSDMMTIMVGKLVNVECAPGWICATQCKP